MKLSIPKSRVTREQWLSYVKDPETVTLEALFIGLTLANIMIVYRILLNVCPFPITLTWFQLLVGLIFALAFGEASREWPRSCALFPAFRLDTKLLEALFAPTLIYVGMLTAANVLLARLPSVAHFPVAVSLAVVLHHVARFVGCGQIYLPVRWAALAVMLIGFLVGTVLDRRAGAAVLPLALAYGGLSATFRAWCLEKVMHAVEGRGNLLHNHQTVIGLVALPPLALLAGEWRFVTWMPHNFGSLFTWQVWGCLVTAGTLPFLKNIVANRLIRKTGQAPWRALEALSMLLVFAIGGAVFGHVGALAAIAFSLVLTGRVFTMLDALSKDPEARQRAVQGVGPAAGSPARAGGAGRSPNYEAPPYVPGGSTDDESPREGAGAAPAAGDVPSTRTPYPSLGSRTSHGSNGNMH